MSDGSVTFGLRFIFSRFLNGGENLPGVFPKFANAKSHSVSRSRLSSLSDLVGIATPLMALYGFGRPRVLRKDLFPCRVGPSFWLQHNVSYVKKNFSWFFIYAVVKKRQEPLPTPAYSCLPYCSILPVCFVYPPRYRTHRSVKG